MCFFFLLLFKIVIQILKHIDYFSFKIQFKFKFIYQRFENKIQYPFEVVVTDM